MNTIGQFALAACALAIIAPIVIGKDDPLTSRKSASNTHQSNQARRQVQRNPDHVQNEDDEGEDEYSEAQDEEAQPEVVSYGVAVATRDNRCHFNFEAQMNGQWFDVMVDTGASAVAINRSTAEQMGIDVSDNDFVHTAITANGTTEFARATIDSITIGDITVYNVEATVLSDESLDNILLGNSFLSKVNMNTRGDTLTLTQV